MAQKVHPFGAPEDTEPRLRKVKQAAVDPTDALGFVLLSFFFLSWSRARKNGINLT